MADATKVNFCNFRFNKILQLFFCLDFIDQKWNLNGYGFVRRSRWIKWKVARSYTREQSTIVSKREFFLWNLLAAYPTVFRLSINSVPRENKTLMWEGDICGRKTRRKSVQRDSLAIHPLEILIPTYSVSDGETM